MVIESYRAPDFPIHLGGALAMSDHINRAMERDMGPFMILSLAIMLVLLFMLFRRLSGSLLPIFVVMLSVFSTIGIMVMIGVPGSTAVQILPVFLLSVGVCDAVHILTIVYQRLRASHPAGPFLQHYTKPRPRYAGGPHQFSGGGA